MASSFCRGLLLYNILCHVRKDHIQDLIHLLKQICSDFCTHDDDSEESCMATKHYIDSSLEGVTLFCFQPN